MFQFAVLATLLGVKHSFDADHLLAVSNLLSQARSLKHSIKMSAGWAAGHMLTATFATALLFTFKDSLLPLVLDKMELLSALALVFLGLLSLLQLRLLHAHSHAHQGKKHYHWHLHLPEHTAEHSHWHMFGIGAVQGLASNDELLVLLTAALGLSSLADMALGVLLFSAGVAIGMTAYSLLLTYPILKTESTKLAQAVNAIAGCASIIFGITMLSRI